MPKVWKGKGLWAGGVLLAALMPLQAAASAVPGTINYIEGQVRLEGRALTTKSAGSVELEPHQVLATDHGKAEILLTPGVFLRVGDNSSVRMVSPELANTQVELLNGEAMVEANVVLKDNNITVVDQGVTTRLEKNGLYEFKTAPAKVAVYDGKASVLVYDRKVTLKKGKEALLAGTVQAQSFDRKAQDPLYAWSNLRSEYNSEASVAEARNIYVGGGGWWGPGWYWNPWWDMYSFIPGGYLYSPFGFGFFAPGFAYYAPAYGFHRFGTRPMVLSHGFAAHAPMSRATAPAARGLAPTSRGGFAGGGLHGGGGFHGGFHGGRR